ncbi:MAG: DUF3048 domain-containing protein [Oscillospiraceae bacterium]|jgi:hypothetical protein|nr:DUF3048 domain-containing protein [Oscillospiraceae bacterium]
MPKEPGQQKNGAEQEPKKAKNKPAKKKPAGRPSISRSPQGAAGAARNALPYDMSARQKQVRRQRIMLLGITLFLVLAAGVLVMAVTGVFSKDSDPVMPDLPKYTSFPAEQGNAKRINPLTGLRDLNASAAGKRAVSFMVNNAPAARPQWGLCAPDVITETLVEGGITRMLFMFSDLATVPKVGPIRSARHDFVEITEGFDSFLIHWGGSPQAYEAIKARGVNNLDGMVYSGKYFFRDKTRLNQGLAVEHTAYTNSEYITAGIAAKGWRTDVDPAKTSPFRFVTEGAAARVPIGGSAAAVNFRFSANYKYSFEYNKTTGLYAQYLNNTPFVQDGGQQRKVTNIILIYVDVQQIAGDKKNRVNIDMSGGGGIYVTAGGWETITWKKGKPAEPLQLLDKDGAVLELNRGKGYIGMVPIVQRTNTTVSE